MIILRSYPEQGRMNRAREIISPDLVQVSTLKIAQLTGHIVASGQGSTREARRASSSWVGIFLSSSIDRTIDRSISLVNCSNLMAVITIIHCGILYSIRSIYASPSNDRRSNDDDHEDIRGPGSSSSSAAGQAVSELGSFIISLLPIIWELIAGGGGFYYKLAAAHID